MLNSPFNRGRYKKTLPKLHLSDAIALKKSKQKCMQENLKHYPPAFPNKKSNTSSDGMLLLDYFAARAMEAFILANSKEVAEKAYKVASDMIVKRNAYLHVSQK